MAGRNEFSVAVKNQIVERSKVDGQICCEGCGLVLGHKPYQIDHIKPDGLRDKSVKTEKLTAEDGQLLGQECCHKDKTKDDLGKITKAIMQGKKNNGVKKKTAKIPAPLSKKKADKDRNKRDPFAGLPRRRLYG